MRILFLATSSFPGDSAYSTRIYGLCKSLQLAGIETDVLTDYSNDNTGSFVHSNINVHVGSKHVYSKRSIIDRLLTYPRMILLLKKLIKIRHYDCIIMSSIYMRVNTILRIAHKSKIPIILESCEWFESYNWRKQEKSYEYKKYLDAWNNSFPKVDGVIAISRMLEDHYKKYVDKVIRIPTIIEIPKENHNVTCGNPIRIIFSGSIAWGKDRLSEIIYAIDELSKEGLSFELNIYGPSFEAVQNQLENADPLNNQSIIIHGRIPHDDVISKCEESDFGIILRPNRKQSNAGFPTKLAEYMASGASVIANDTGDISLFIEDGINGFLLSTDFKYEELIYKLRMIASLPKEEVSNIKNNAFEFSSKSFNYSQYSEALGSFVREVVFDYTNTKTN